MRVYKIRDKETGLYNTGGTGSYWSKQGRLWTGIGHLKQHLSSITHDHTPWRKRRSFTLPPGWELVEFDLVETRTIPVAELTGGEP